MAKKKELQIKRGDTIILHPIALLIALKQIHFMTNKEDPDERKFTKFYDGGPNVTSGMMSTWKKKLKIVSIGTYVTAEEDTPGIREVWAYEKSWIKSVKPQK